MIVAKAAHFTQSSGKKNNQKINKGSKMIFNIAQISLAFIGVKVSPWPLRKLVKIIGIIIKTLHIIIILRYQLVIFISSGFCVKNHTIYFMKNIHIIKVNILYNHHKNVIKFIVACTFFFFHSQTSLEIKEEEAIPKPQAIDIKNSCIGNDNDRAISHLLL